MLLAVGENFACKTAVLAVENVETGTRRVIGIFGVGTEEIEMDPPPNLHKIQYTVPSTTCED